MENSTTDWLNKLQQTYAEIEMNHLDFIIDQCGIDFSVIPVLQEFSPHLKWQSLYKGLPEDALSEDAPLLVRMTLNDPQQNQWLSELAQKVQKTAPLMVICSQWPFSALAEWLTDCVDATHEGRAGLFRYFDARIFPFLFSDILTQEQQVQLQRPALFWSWLDLDGKPALLMGNGSLPGKSEKCQKVTFSDSQFELLMCLCDVKLLLRYQNIPEAWFESLEERFSACFRAMVAATDKRILLDKEREAWVVKTLESRQ